MTIAENCNTQCFDRRCRGERVVRISRARVLTVFPNLTRPRPGELGAGNFLWKWYDFLGRNTDNELYRGASRSRWRTAGGLYA